MCDWRSYSKIYLTVAALSLFATLWLPFVGEEGVYTHSALEMLFHHDYVNTLFFGKFYGRPPLLNWFILLGIKLVGPSYILLISRFINASASILTAFITYRFILRLSRNRDWALLTSVIYFSGDCLFRRGWLAYADNVFSLFIVTALCSLLLACAETNTWFIVAALLVLFAALLTKALSCLVFYGLSILCLLFDNKHRQFLLRPISLSLHSAFGAMLLIMVWIFPQYAQAMLAEMADTSYAPTWINYLYQVIIYHPVLFIVHFLPVSFLLLWARYQRSIYFREWFSEPWCRIIFWIVTTNFVVCWFAPRWPEARYYLPLYPFIAMLAAWMLLRLWRSDEKNIWLQRTFWAFALTLVLKWTVGTFGFYVFAHYRQANYADLAQKIVKRVGTQPLYIQEPSCVSLLESVGTEISVLRYPKAPPISVPKSSSSAGYCLSDVLLALPITEHYSVRRDNIYLFYTADPFRQCK
jgi:4-amino-4-deoxy-L-arabinose transferase-like glycosyltransferase